MPFQFEFDHLLKYTEWDRAQWEVWFREQGKPALAVGLGPNADGAVKTVGELARHIFAAELRYVQRVRGLPLMEASTVAADDVEALFAFGRQSRAALRALLADLPEERWDIPQEIQMGSHKRAVTPKTMIVQAVTHEMRHWAQMATLLRLNGKRTGAHDFLVSGVFESHASP